MTEKPNTGLPKSALSRLRAQQGGGAPAGEHPDANLLAAFSEQALEAGEREQVLMHLGRCADCREIVALNLPAVEEKSFVEEKRGWLGLRPELMRWGIVGASAAVVVAAVLLVKPELESPRAIQNQVTIAKPTDRADQAVGEASGVAREAPKLTAGVADRATEKEAKKADEKRRDAASERGYPMAAPPPPPSALGVSGGSSGGVLGGVMSPKVEEGTGRAAGAAAANESKDMRTTPAVVAQSQPQANAPVPVFAEEDRMQASQAKTLAKQKVDEDRKMMAADSNTVAARATKSEVSGRRFQLAAATRTWRIAGGKLQWSGDGGASWTIASLPDGVKAMAVDAGVPGVVWVGAASGMVLRSADQGASWTPVKGLWRGDVVYLKFQDAVQGTLRTSNHEEWFSEDGGMVWKRR
ncbi:MAG TPA: hypothetical protein VMZ25_04225 [Terriglobales bacterium]|nr:hypothetical protein [Terriglobales bacterium]